MSSEKIDILIHYDRLQESLFNIYFYPSYKKYLSQFFNLISIREENLDDNATSDYLSSHWSYMIVKRFDHIKDYIRKNIQSNKLAIFSDIDVIFFDDISKEIISLDQDKNTHIFYMKEGIALPQYMINGGFFVFRCCRESLDFFDMIQDKTSLNEIKNDQPIIQEVFKNKNTNIDYSILDADIFCTNNNIMPYMSKIIDTMKVFHATSATSVIEKCQVLSTAAIIKEYLKSGKNKEIFERKNLWINIKI